MRKLRVTSGRSQENSFVVITLYTESNCTCRKKKNFLFHWKLSMSSEQHTHHWTYCWKNRLKITGTWMEKKNCLMHGQDSQDLFYWRKGLLTDTHGLGGDLQWNKIPLLLAICGQICGNLGPMQRKRKQNKDMGHRGTKVRQCRTIERNILHWAKRRTSSQWKPLAESSDASSNALQNIDEEQWRNPPQYWETTKYASVVDADESTRPRLEGAGHKTSSRSHHCKRNEFADSLMDLCHPKNSELEPQHQ